MTTDSDSDTADAAEAGAETTELEAAPEHVPKRLLQPVPQCTSVFPQ
jgi:hypothetical protein